VTSLHSNAPSAANPVCDLAGLSQYFEQLTPHSVAQMGDWYSPEVKFKDPFNDIVGIAAVQRLFLHMFEALYEPRFEVSGQFLQGNQAMLLWTFHFRFKSYRSDESQVIRGCSHLVFDPDGRVEIHRDYWDAAEELYEKLPVLGRLMRWLKARAAH